MTDHAQSELVTNAAAASMRRHQADSRLRGPKVVMPGGRVVSATEYLKNNHRFQKQASTFADIDQHPEKYLKQSAIRPGFRYIWISTKDADSLSRVRSKRYIEVDADDMLEESELPYVPGTSHLAKSTQKGPRGTVEIYDVRLCAVSPRAWDELFGSRESMAVAKIASDTDSFYANMEQEGATAEVEVTDDKGRQLSDSLV